MLNETYSCFNEFFPNFNVSFGTFNEKHDAKIKIRMGQQE